jgi:chitinase
MIAIVCYPSWYGRRPKLRLLFSQLFLICVETLKDNFSLPPKRYLVTTFVPSAWVDDALIAERKAGLTKYLSDLLSSPEFEKNTTLLKFLTAPETSTPDFSLEDALPSTLSRKAGAALAAAVNDVETQATPVAGAYYTDWSGKSPESLDFSKFDILFFGQLSSSNCLFKALTHCYPAFAIPTSSSGITYNSSLLQRLVTAARNSGKGTKVVLSIGNHLGTDYMRLNSFIDRRVGRVSIFQPECYLLSSFDLRQRLQERC